MLLRDCEGQYNPDGTFNGFDTKQSNVILILFNIEQYLCWQSSQSK